MYRGEGSAAGGQTKAAQRTDRIASVTITAMRALANVTPVPRWADAALTTSYKTIYKCKLKGDTQGQARAERNVARILRRFQARYKHSPPWFSSLWVGSWKRDCQGQTAGKPLGRPPQGGIPEGGSEVIVQPLYRTKVAKSPSSGTWDGGGRSQTQTHLGACHSKQRGDRARLQPR